MGIGVQIGKGLQLLRTTIMGELAAFAMGGLCTLQ